MLSPPPYDRNALATKPSREVSGSTSEFLLAEYRYLADSFWRNEEGGEKRVNFFITLVTAVLAALVALATKQGSLTDGQIVGISFAACLGLLAVGILTFLRLIRRNHVSDSYKRAMDRLRCRFREWDPAALGGHEPFPKSDRPHRSFGRGGLTDLVAAVNSVIAAAAAATLAAVSDSVAAIAAVTSVVFLASLVAHAYHLERSYRGTWFRDRLWRVERFVGMEPHEVESSLVVVSRAAPGKLFGAVESFDKLAGFALGPVRSEEIHDVYYDTPTGCLGAHRIALRLRALDGRQLVTLKGPSKRGRWGGESRLELEREWSSEAWRDVAAELRRRDVEIDSVLTADDPGETLEAAGFEVVQDRRSARRARDLRPAGGGGRLAELVLDTVTYELGEQVVRLYEIEIEAKARRGAEAVAVATAALVERYWPGLRPWPHGKLPTGRKAAELIAGGRSDLLGRGGELKPRAFDEIADALERD
jgi:CYTH domain